MRSRPSPIPIRRDIVARLAEGSATVAEATREIPVSKPAISKHLKVLEEAGVVTRVIDGRKHRLSLEPERARRGRRMAGRAAGSLEQPARHR